MKFDRFADGPSPFRDAAGFAARSAAVRSHWRSVGWEECPPEDDPAIETAWKACFGHGKRLRIPTPYRRWQGRNLERHRLRPEAEVDFTLKFLAAIRFCTPPGNRLWAVEWQHACYRFDPHGGIVAASRDEWPYPLLPDGDAFCIFDPESRYGFVSGWRTTGPITVFGASLLTAFDADPPCEFLALCGPGVPRNV